MLGRIYQHPWTSLHLNLLQVINFSESMARSVLNYKSGDHWRAFATIPDYSHECSPLFETILTNYTICLFAIHDYLFSGFSDTIYTNVMQLQDF